MHIIKIESKLTCTAVRQIITQNTSILAASITEDAI
jgi:hypothetical protein